jgi:hypothetical protein
VWDSALALNKLTLGFSGAVLLYPEVAILSGLGELMGWWQEGGSGWLSSYDSSFSTLFPGARLLLGEGL